ncbi:GMC family oxidoreductase [Streptomyces sp. NPDC087300]|uniref:GMC family oxidoreductase n=1 Tax=Streptomyces sp. NPDC087300 TaxID=3365780 RepID=UPI0037F83E04
MPEHDFIVVGAGTAGCVLAARLSEDASTRVLLVEAGGARMPPEQRVPSVWPGLLQGPASWGEFTAHPVIEACLEAASETGYARAADISGGLEEGFGLVDLNIVDGRRQSAADAYLAPVLDRPNLTVVTDALVHGLRIAGGRYHGVEYRVGAETVSADCSGEVVLAAGTIGSAQLLLRSGVGPRPHLADVGVGTVLDLPGVGTGLHDHPIAGVVFGATRTVSLRESGNLGEAIGLVRSDPSLDAPDLQVLFVEAPTHLPSVKGPENGYTIAVALMRPRSRGTVRLASAAPDASPLLDPEFYADERDMAAVIAGVRLVREIGAAQALAPWGGAEALPGPGTEDDDAIRAYLSRTLASYCHPVGTCRMGDDPLSVVGTDLRVHGIEGLRVADASVLPSIPSANTVATVYAVAERAADLLRADH